MSHLIAQMLVNVTMSVSYCLLSLPLQLSFASTDVPPAVLLPANRCPDSQMALYWRGCRRMLSRLARSKPTSLSCDWLLEGTEATWSQCPTSRIATHQREMKKGETERVCACVCCLKFDGHSNCVCVCVHLWCKHERKANINCGFDRSDRWKNSCRLGWMDWWMDESIHRCRGAPTQVQILWVLTVRTQALHIIPLDMHFACYREKKFNARKDKGMDTFLSDLLL